MRKALAAAALALLLIALPQALAVSHPPMPPISQLTSARCVRVVDGDTAWFEFERDGVMAAHSVRFLNVDTPETVHPTVPVQPFGPEASAFTAGELLDKRVYLEFDKRPTDLYGRFLAFVWLEDGRLFNLRLVELGYGEAWVIRPNRKYEDVFWAAHREAHAAGIGLWQAQTALPRP